MKKILIIGANSYIGSSFQSYLGQFPGEYDVDTLSVRDDGWKQADFFRYDILLDTAGIAHRRETPENASLYYQINGALTGKLAKKAKREGVRQFVFLSSASVYGQIEGIITKDTPPAPQSHYGRSKLQAEELLRQLHDSSFSVTILRPPMVYGDGCKGNYQTLVKLAKKLPFFADYQNRRSMISIGNLCAFLKSVMDTGEGGIYFPQDPEYVCTCQMIRQIAERQGRNLPLLPVLNPCIGLLKRMTTKGKKAFGDLIYEGTDACIEKF